MLQGVTGIADNSVVAGHRDASATSTHRTHFATVPSVVAYGRLAVEIYQFRVIRVSSDQQASVYLVQHGYTEGIHTVVHCPAVTDSRMRLAQGHTFQPFRGGSIKTVGGKNYVTHHRVCSACTDIPCLLDFATCHIYHHDAKTGSQIGHSVVVTYAVYRLVATYLTAFYVRQIIHTVLYHKVEV